LLFYDGNFLEGYQWAASVGAEPDALFLGNLNLYSGQGNRAWFDDLSIRGARCLLFPYPHFDCLLKNQDADRCAEFIWRFTNDIINSHVDTFYIDVEAGHGGRDTACIGSTAGAEAIVPPPGWSVSNCTGWYDGHALFEFTSDTPADAIPPGGSVTGFITVDPNESRAYEREPYGTQPAAVIPPLTVSMAAADRLGCNSLYAACEPNDFRFGPRACGTQGWSSIRLCEAPLNVPTLSRGMKGVLLALLLACGTLLVLRSLRVGGRAGLIAA
jgi:hypothetical protein